MLAISTGVIDILGSSSIILLFKSEFDSAFGWEEDDISLKHHMFR